MRRPLYLCLAAMALAAAACEQALAPTAPDGIVRAPGGFLSSLVARAGVATAANPESGAGTLTIERPTEVVAGDLLLAHITFEKGAEINNVVPPSPEWLLVLRTNSIDVERGTDLGQAVFRKLATDSEPANYTWQFRKGTSLEQVRAAGAVSRYTGVDRYNPIVASSAAAGDGTALTAPAITAEAKSQLVALFGHKKRTTLSTPAGMTRAYDVLHSNQSGPTVQASDELVAVAGSTGARTSNASAVIGADKWVAQLVALRAAATVTVIKVVDPVADPGLFDLQVNGVTHRAAARNGDGTGQVIVPAGSAVTVGELAGSDDTNLDDYDSAISCDTDKGSSDGTSHTFTIAAGDDVICTITNTRKAKVELLNVVDPADDPGLFDLQINGVTHRAGARNGDGTGQVIVPLSSPVTVGVLAGSADTDLNDYDTEVTCNSDKGSSMGTGHTFTVNAGDNVICTITNTRKAKVELLQVVDPADDPGLFDLQINGVTQLAGARNGDGTGQVIVPLSSAVTVGVLAGSADTDLNDYDTEVTCNSGKGSTEGTSHAFTVTAGAHVICTITNTRKDSGLLFYLHNRATQPSAATTSLANLPMNATLPANAGALPNYDTNRDSRPGRFIQKNSPSATQTDLGKYQNWVSPAFPEAYTINKSSNAQVTIWTAMKDQVSDKTGRIRVYVRRCPGVPQTGCVVIGQADYTRPRGAPFSQATVSVPWTFTGTSLTVSAGQILEVKVVVLDTSEDDMWFGYDTVAMPASFVYVTP